MKKIIVEIRVENTIELEVPNELNEDEAYDYIMDNYQDDIALAINGGDFAMDVMGMDDPEEDNEEENSDEKNYQCFGDVCGKPIYEGDDYFLRKSIDI